MTRKIEIAFETSVAIRNGEEWEVVPAFVASYVILHELSFGNTFYGGNDNVLKVDEDDAEKESIWWKVMNMDNDEQLWMNNADGEMFIVGKEIAYYRVF